VTTILVVDDEKATRDFLVDTLKLGGFETLTAADGEAGLRAIHQQMPDLIIADVRMPNLNGFEFLEALRANPKTNTIPVIMLTAVKATENMRTSMLAGAADYLVKPVSPGDLLAAINTQLDKQAAIAEKHDTTLKLLRKNIIYALPHELRTPLHLISGYASLLAADYQTVKPEAVLDAAQAILGASDRLQRLIENYLVYAQLELIADDPEQVRALRNQFTRDVSAIMAVEAARKAKQVGRSADLHLELTPQAMRITEQNLKKLIVELVDNAFKFSKPGQAVKIHAVREGNIYRITITDEGVGMTPEQVRGLGGGFTQFERALREQQGVGLGFSVARRLIELHEGSIQIESAPQHGTSLTICLPIV
jgi:signal transduction histidine kinase